MLSPSRALFRRFRLRAAAPYCSGGFMAGCASDIRPLSEAKLGRLPTRPRATLLRLVHQLLHSLLRRALQQALRTARQRSTRTRI